MMKTYDAHIHILFQDPSDDIKHSFAFLEGVGLSGFDALVIPDYPDNIETILRMVPELYHEYVNPLIFAKQRDVFPLMNQLTKMKITSFADVRFVENNVEQKVRRYRDMGFEGLKFIYVPEEDHLLKMGGMEQAFGRTLKQSERVVSLLIESAASQGMLVLFHVDLRKYADFAKEIVKSYPQINFNIPHFGFSRTAIASLLDDYSNCYTDTSAVIPSIKKDPSSYLDFIKHYRNRVLFGTDTLISYPDTVQRSMQFFFDLLDTPELCKKIFYENYITFHKKISKGQAIDRANGLERVKQPRRN